ncbi:S26 family signal peptidase [Leptospira sarikeiensis]|uniref:Peptidase S26 domain-containing protein n=1 Tax=Leptospira sarikeiensis TaxID=2484943 RepID=A0A4R9K309_9LEPT|nr:S26 family signal peptidase [Leptospira sarikeiensis]TGL60430.1 hypothetical protein EHQ64_11330 [Leptospira sarikeiensis]
MIYQIPEKVRENIVLVFSIFISVILVGIVLFSPENVSALIKIVSVFLVIPFFSLNLYFKKTQSTFKGGGLFLFIFPNLALVGWALLFFTNFAVLILLAFCVFIYTLGLASLFRLVRFFISVYLNFLFPPAGFLFLKDLRSSVIFSLILYPSLFTILSLFHFLGEGFGSYFLFWALVLFFCISPFLLVYFTRKSYYRSLQEKDFFLFVENGKIFAFAGFFVLLLVFSFFGTWFVKGSWVDFYELRSDAMEPNFQRGDLVLVLKSDYDLKRGDPILKRTEENLVLPSRVIGLPRDTISYKYSTENLPALTEIFVNGIPIRSGEFDKDYVHLDEDGNTTVYNHSLVESILGKSYTTIYSEKTPDSIMSLFQYFPFKVITLGKEQYFSLEDNRTYGIVPIFYPPLAKENIVGKVLIRIFSINWRDSICRELEEEPELLSQKPECNLGLYGKLERSKIRWRNIASE